MRTLSVAIPEADKSESFATGWCAACSCLNELNEGVQMKHKNQQSKRGSETPHPGSNPDDVKAVGGKNDFGAREDNVTERAYVSKNTKLSDPGAAPMRA